MEKSKKGGTRPGAGRPLTGTEKRVTISARVSPETAARLRELREVGWTLGRFIDYIVEQFKPIQ